MVQAFVQAAENGLYLPDRLATPRTPSGLEWHYARGTWRDIYGETSLRGSPGTGSGRY
ncbi:hypothetical protein [Candidatus Palauibacter sp.]|uniref:hypothetical protein n=1 Tax=Candidatus Palauibacter sp. TaxID=3101350 RepID=UPI003B52BBBF